MLMGARIAHNDARHAHMGVRIEHMDTRTVCVGARLLAAIQDLLFAIRGTVLSAPILTVCCCTSLSPTVTLSAFVVVESLQTTMMVSLRSLDLPTFLKINQGQLNNVLT